MSQEIPQNELKKQARRRTLLWSLWLLSLVGGFQLGVRRPLWFKPPLFSITPLFYLLLSFSWIPVGVYIAWKGVVRGRIRLIAAAVFTLIVACLWLTLLYPSVGPELPTLGSVGELDCAYQVAAGGDREYHCTHQFQDFDVNGISSYRFLAPEWLPWLVLVEIDRQW